MNHSDKLQEIELTICTDFTKLKAQDLVWLVERIKELEKIVAKPQLTIPKHKDVHTNGDEA